MEKRNTKLDELEQLLDLAPCGIGLFDIATGETVFLNQVYYYFVGYTPEEYREIHKDGMMNRIVPEDIGAKYDSAEEFAKSGMALNYEYRIIRKDDQVMWLKMSASTVLIDEKKYALVSFTDITKEKEIATQLTLVTQNVGSSLSLIRFCKGKKELIYGNDQFFRYSGIDKSECNTHIESFNRTAIAEKDFLQMQQAIDKAIKSGKPTEMVHKYITENGELLWLNRRFATIKQDTPDTYLLVSIVTDVTARKNAELENALEQRRFRTVIEELNAAVFEWDLKTNSFYSSEAYKNYEVSRVNAEQLLNNEGPLEVVHPDDIPDLQQFFRDSESGNERTETVLRIKMIDGTFHWCRMLGFFYKDEDGTPSRTIGVIIDINEEHEQSIMMSTLLNEIPGGVAIFSFGKTLECQYYSDGFALLSDRSRDEMDELIRANRLMKESIIPEDYVNFENTIKECVKKDKPINITYRYCKKNGDIGWLHLSATKMRQELDKPIYYCVFTKPTDESALYRSIVEDSAIGVFVMTRKERNILYINEMAREISALPKDKKVAGKCMTKLLSQMGKEMLLTEANIAALKMDCYSEFHIMRNDQYLAVKAKALMWNGVDSYILYVSNETAEYRSKHQLKELVEKVPTGIGVFDIIKKQVVLDYLNDAYYEMIGAEREGRSKFYGHGALEAIHEEDRGNITILVDKLVGGADRGNALIRICNGHGHWIWMKLAVSVIERKVNQLRIYAAFTDCDEIISAQHEMERIRLREQTLMESIPGGTAIYRIKKNGRVEMEYISEGLVRILGYEDFHEIVDATGADSLISIPEEEREDLLKNVLIKLEKRIPISAIYHLRTKDNEMVQVRMDANVIKEAQMGKDDLAVLYAVHTLVSQDSRLAKLEQHRYRALMDALDIAFIEWERDRGFYASDKYDQYAISDEDYSVVLENKGDRTMIQEEDAGKLQEFFDACARKEKKASATVRMKMKDGTYRWTEMVSFNEYDKNGKMMRVIGILRDVDRERIEQNERLHKALHEARKASKAKTEFLSRMSHDIRTPMNAIIGLTHLAETEDDNTKIRDYLRNIGVSSDFLLGLINDILDLSKIESGELKLNPEPFYAEEFENALNTVIKPLMDAKEIDFSFQVNGGADCILVDKLRFNQIFFNLLSNAAKFTPKGGQVEFVSQQIPGRNGLHGTRYRIKDNGIGMSPEFLLHLFDSFSQEKNDENRDQVGSGLGLPIVKSLVDAMGGEISVKSEKGKGTEFILDLYVPLAEGEREQIQNIWEEYCIGGADILLVEDNDMNILVAKTLLEKEGCRVEVAKNGAEAVEKFKKSELSHYDAILMDVRMPVMDGLEATRLIRSLERKDASKVPILAMTADAFENEQKKTLEAGMNCHLSKPIDPKQMFLELFRCIKESQDSSDGQKSSDVLY